MAETTLLPKESLSYSLVLDLDRTLFDTSQFIHDTSEVLEAEFGVDAHRFTQDIPKHYIQTSEALRTYDLFGHIAHLNLDDKAVEYCLKSELPRKPRGVNGYLYSNTADFLDFVQSRTEIEVTSVLTYGKGRTQNLKLFLAAAVLEDLFSAITEESKDAYLRAHFPNGQGIIIDDKDIENLPHNFTHLFIDRTRASGRGYDSLTAIKSDWPHIIGSLVLAS